MPSSHSSADSSHRAKYLPDFAGALLDSGRYILLNRLGKGGYGKVYQALDTTTALSRPGYVAVKCLAMPRRKRHERALRRELKLHARVSDHANVISFLDTFYDDAYIYVILALSNGGDLFKAIVERRLYHRQDDLIKSVFVQITSALEFCHYKGVYHRDLKPENILCTQDGSRVWLADFGLATSHLITGDHGVGSSFYMSYENINFDDGFYDSAKNDIWACGVILINMVTGRNPWCKAVDDDDCFSRFLQDPDFIRLVLPISHEMNEITKAVLHPDPELRISLAELQIAVLDASALFMTVEELSTASKAVKEAAVQAAAPARSVSMTQSSERSATLSTSGPVVLADVEPVLRHTAYPVAPPSSREPSSQLETSHADLDLDDDDDDVSEAVTPEDALVPIQNMTIDGDSDVPELPGGENGCLGGCSPVTFKVDLDDWQEDRKPWYDMMPSFKKTVKKIKRISGAGGRQLTVNEMLL